MNASLHCEGALLQALVAMAYLVRAAAERRAAEEDASLAVLVLVVIRMLHYAVALSSDAALAPAYQSRQRTAHSSSALLVLDTDYLSRYR